MDSRKEYQVISRLRFVRRVNRMFALSVFTAIVFVLLFVYQPMRLELEKSLTDNFTQLSRTSFHAFESSIQRGLEGAKSLSSRTMIKDAIADYKNGAMSLAELKAFTGPKYKDGAIALEHLVSAARIVDGLVIAEYGAAGGAADSSFPTITERPTAEAISKIIVAPYSVNAVMVSRVMHGSRVLGYDLIVYDLTQQLDRLNTDAAEMKLLDRNAYRDLLSGAAIIKTDEDMTIFSKSGSIYAAFHVQDDIYFLSVQKQSSLFAPVDKLAVRIAAGGTIAFLAYAILVYLYIIRFAKRELGDLEVSRDEYKKIAFLDHLTGAYSRQFLDVWNGSLRSSQHTYAIVMIDVDDLKKINDIYGHAAGDKVLQDIAKAILESIGQSDLLVRYGGDEFVLIFSDVMEERACYFMERIESHIRLSREGSFPVSISYGVSLLTCNLDFAPLLKQADEKMYEAKKKKKQTY